jgi:hypothetical protein
MDTKDIPNGGFPPIIQCQKKIKQQQYQFNPTKNTVSISNIINSIKK